MNNFSKKETNNEQLETELSNARKLLLENGYAVILKSKSMLKDEAECEEMQCNGNDKDCFDCSCTICIRDC